MNYFRGQESAPYHLSVGAVILDEQNRVACLHFSTDDHGTKGEAYLLMRETVEQGETLAEAVRRGIKEEIGVEAEIQDFIGTIISHFGFRTTIVEKTTLYFLCKALFKEAKPEPNNAFEASGILEWRSIDFLIEQGKKQAAHFQRDDIDESTILECVQKLM